MPRPGEHNNGGQSKIKTVNYIARFVPMIHDHDPINFWPRMLHSP